jgi:hypothetical protein
MKNVFERWAETEPYGVMRCTPEELDALHLEALTKVIIGRNGVTVMAGDRIVSHREYQR